jgi:hypothetical protein
MNMQRPKLSILAPLSIAISLTACGASDQPDVGDDGNGMDEAAESAEGAQSLGSLEQGIINCSNPDGTNAAMAAFAVAVARELGRWQTSLDFVVARTNGITENSTGNVETLKLASGSDASGARGKSRCSDGKCINVQALLDLQYDQVKGKVYFQGTGTSKVELNPAALRSRMVAKWREQEACDKTPKDGDSGSCPKEEHSLAFVSAAKGSCDTEFTFNVKQKDARTSLRYPQQLKNKLRFADSANGYINFTPLPNGDVKIDPTFGLNIDDTTSMGACVAACTKISVANVADQCCSCAGINRKFARAAWSSVTFICQ